MDQLFKRVQERAFMISYIFINQGIKDALTFLVNEVNGLTPRLAKSSRKTRPSSLQFLNLKMNREFRMIKL